MAFKKGKPKTGGRRPGVENKTTRELKELIREALELNGGVQYLRRQAVENPSAFLGLLGKILPRDVNTVVSGDGFKIEVVTGIPPKSVK